MTTIRTPGGSRIVIRHGETLDQAIQRGRGVRETTMLQLLRNFVSQSDGVEMDGLLALSAFGKGLRAEYGEAVLPVPDWLEESLKAVRSEIISRRRDALEKERKTLLMQREALKSADEKRKDLDARLAKLDQALGDGERQSA
jgi:hypothetical protein